MIGTSRISVSIPAEGTSTLVGTGGRSMFIENSVSADPDAIPLIRFDTPNADAFPAYGKSQIHRRFERFYVDGNSESEGQTLYITIAQTGGFTVEPARI